MIYISYTYSLNSVFGYGYLLSDAEEPKNHNDILNLENDIVEEVKSRGMDIFNAKIIILFWKKL